MKPWTESQHRKKKPMQAYETMRWKPVCGNQHNSVKKKLPIFFSIIQIISDFLKKSLRRLFPII